MTHLVTLIDELLRRQIRFRSLCDGALDTTTASGELVFHVFSALAQFERRWQFHRDGEQRSRTQLLHVQTPGVTLLADRDGADLIRPID